MSEALEAALSAIANMVPEQPPFGRGQPLWVHGDDHTAWLPIAFFRAGWSEWWAACVPEDELTAEPYNIPCSWLSDLMPNEKRNGNVIYVNFSQDHGD